MNRRRLLVLAYAASGAAALTYEVAWARELSEVLGSTVYAVSTMLAAFMGGLALGSYLGGRIADRSASPLLGFARLEFGVATLGLLSVPLLAVLPNAFFSVYVALRPQMDAFMALQFAFAFLVMLPPTVAMGATFPFVAKAVVPTLERAGSALASVYAANTAGSIVGSIGAGFLLIPHFGVRGTILAAAILNLAAASTALALSRRGIWAFGRTEVAMGVLALALAVAIPGTATVKLGFYEIGRIDSVGSFKQYAEGAKLLYDADGVYGRVAVVEYADGVRTLRNGGMTEGSSGYPDRQMTGLLAALPLASASRTDTALVIGLGTGYTSAMLLRSGVSAVNTVEINREVVPAAGYFIGTDILRAPNWTIDVADGRNYLLLNDARYDVITSEPSWPSNKAVSHLFTGEFFDLVESRLNDGGAFAQWMPNYLLTSEDLDVMYKTFVASFPNSYVWTVDSNGATDSEIVFIGVKGEGRLDAERVRRRADELLAESDLNDTPFRPYGDMARLDAARTDPTVRVNTDDAPYLEFAVVENRVRRFAEEGR